MHMVGAAPKDPERASEREAVKMNRSSIQQLRVCFPRRRSSLASFRLLGRLFPGGEQGVERLPSARPRLRVQVLLDVAWGRTESPERRSQRLCDGRQTERDAVTSVDARLRGREADLPEVFRSAGRHVEEPVPGARRQLLLLLFI